MTHLDPEQLAHLAMHPDGPVDAAQRAHLDECAGCRAELTELRDVFHLARTTPAGALPPAPPRIWDRVLDELGPEIGVTPRPAVPSSSSSSASEPASGSSRRRPWVLVAAAVGLVLGIVGTWVVLGTDDTSEPPAAATVRLEPLSGKNGSGSAKLFQTTHGQELRVGSSGLGTPPGFYEVWLINSDGKRMVSLGVLDSAGGGTFGVPANVVAEGYRIVDVSLEPNDGNPEHSRNSIIRGNLPS